MTDKELLQMSLDALEKHIYEYETIEAIKARLAQPDCVCGEPDSEGVHRKDKPCYMPQKKEWVGLTDEEIKKLSDDCVGVRDETEFIRAIEAKLKEKNGAT